MKGARLATPTLFLAVFAMFVIAFADLATKQSAGKISPSLGTLVYAATTVVIPLVWTLWTRANGGLLVTRDGLLWSLAVGVSFSIFTGSMFLLFSRGVDLSIGSPLVRMGGVVVAASFGILILREQLNLQFLAGFALTVAGIFLVVTR